MKISFDFDFTITEKKMQDLAEKFINAGHDVWIVTARLGQLENPNFQKVVFKMAESLGIANKIIFTNEQPKYSVLGKNNFDLHFDDDQNEIYDIENNLKNCIGVLFTSLEDMQS